MASSVPSPPSSAGAGRRRPRVRAAHKLAHLRAQVAAYSHVALALPLVHDADAVWDAFLDDDTKRARRQLRQLATAMAHARALAAERATLADLVRDHRLATHAIRALLAEDHDDWARRVQRWRALARIHFCPWTPAQFAHEIATIERVIAQLESPPPVDGPSLFGWRASVGVASSHLHFRLHKTFRALDCASFLDAVERIFTDTDAYARVVHNGRARAAVDVLQTLAPHAAIVMYHEQYARGGGVDATMHMLSLNVRMESGDSVLQVYRPIHARAIVRAFVGPRDAWMTNFHWARYTTNASSGDVAVSVHGTLRGDDLAAARYWQFRVLESLVRVEATAARHDLVAF